MKADKAPHLCVFKPDWSWRPRLYVHYFDTVLGDWRYIGIFRDKNNNYIGVNGCRKSA